MIRKKFSHGDVNDFGIKRRESEKKITVRTHENYLSVKENLSKATLKNRFPIDKVEKKSLKYY